MAELSSGSMILWLIGYMGSGKTTIGRLLADRMSYAHIDTDQMIEHTIGIPIETLIHDLGWTTLRQIERSICQKLVVDCPSCVISTGGGLAIYSFHPDEMSRYGRSIWLDVSVDIAYDRIQSDKSIRPIARSKHAFYADYNVRQSIYAKADARVVADDSIDTVLDSCVEIVEYWLHKDHNDVLGA